MHKHTATKIAAGVLAAFHVLFAVLPTALPSHSCGGGQAAILTIVLDLPLVALTEVLPHSSPFFYDTLIKSVQFFWVAGTLMYAGVGALIGWFIDAVRHSSRPT